MMRVTTLAAAMTGAAAMKMPLWINESTICDGGHCDTPNLAYQWAADIQPGYQWGDAGGYCGSWATQRAVLASGAWISQQQVRDHTSSCGPNDEEILSCNIEEAWVNLKIDYERFDYDKEPLPQTTAYAKWLKRQLVQKRTVAWMIMWSGQAYPIYNLEPPAGMYGHVEPVIGIQSNHPLNDTTVYDDDVVLHFTDGGVETVHRGLTTLPCDWDGVKGHKADCGEYKYGVGNPYGFGWAVKGFTHDEKPLVPASLKIKPWNREPDTRSGEDPIPIAGTLTAMDLEFAHTYEIYRWDSVDEAFTYTNKYKKVTFTPAEETYVYEDDKPFMSDSATYYRVVKVQ